jgi:hypothetical protein
MSLVALLASCVWVPRDDGGYRDHDRNARQGYYDRDQNGNPREGYYDRDHDRYYHDHAWHPCRDRDDPHCH